MKAISPVIINDSMISNYTSVADWSGLVWISGTAYTSGQIVLISGTHDLYLCQFDYSGTDSPANNPLNPSGNAYWVYYGVENKFKIFDAKTRAKTINSGPINLEITPNQNVNSIAILGFSVDYLKVTLTSLQDGIVFSREIELADLTGVSNDYYLWHITPPSPKEQFIKIDFPIYSDYTIKIESSNSNGDTEIGEIIVGFLEKIGVYQYGSSYEDEDFSLKERDQFGNATLIKKDFVKIVNYQAIVFREDVARVKNFLSRNRTNGIVYVGEINTPHSIVYGFFKDYNIIESNFSFNDAQISV